MHPQVKSTLLNGLSISPKACKSATSCIQQCLPTGGYYPVPAAATPTIHMSPTKGVTEGGLQKEITLTATSFIYSKYNFLMIL